MSCAFVRVVHTRHAIYIYFHMRGGDVVCHRILTH